MSSPGLTSVRRRFVPILMAAVLLSVTLSPGGQGQLHRTTWKDTVAVRTTAATSSWIRSINGLSRGWTSPGPTRPTTTSRYNFGPLVVDDNAYVLARNNSLVALDATTGKEIWIHAELQGIAPRGINYWESTDRSDRRLLFQRNNYLEAIDAQDGKVDPLVRHHGAVNLGKDSPAIQWARPVTEPGQGLRESHHPRIGARRGLSLHAWRPPRLRRRHRQAGLAVPHHSASRRVRLRNLAAGRWKYVGGANTWGEITVDPGARDRVLPDRFPHVRLLRRRSHRRQSLRHVPRRARRAHRQAPVALPDGAPRFLGLRQHRGAQCSRPSDTTGRSSTSSRRRARRDSSTSSTG